jgi:glycosyltransferase involved in cell wall biosynthesis
MTRIALVLWSGLVGGAESFSVALARQLKEQGVETGVAFVGEPEPLAETLRVAEIPYEALGFARGRDVLLHPHRLAGTVRRLGTAGALLIQPGFLAGALRAGGYRAPIVAVNHGEPLHDTKAGLPGKAKRLLIDVAGHWAADIEVAVSDVVLEALQGRLHARRLVRIYNGVDLETFRPASNGIPTRPLTIGWAGRLVAGKGVEDLIAATARVRQRAPVLLRIAGEGELRGALEEAASGMGEFVRFEGAVADMPSFWRTCDVAATPSNQLAESFGMAAAEAMGCGIPVIASRLGALPEVVSHGRTGLLYRPGDVGELAGALERYALDVELRRAHGLNARRACEEQFDIRDCATGYRRLFEEIRP